ncbi:MAG: BMP family ABC transporter substrate-binding protein [Fimbriimonadaceae bacterium]
MKLKRLSAGLIGVVIFALGCSGEKRSAEVEPSSGEKSLTIGIVFDKGGRGDKSFNDSAWRGIERARNELGVAVVSRDSPADKDYASNLSSLAAKNVDLIVGVGINMEKAMIEAANDNPDSRFAIVDGFIDAPNVRSLRFNEEQGSFLAGYLAGLMTKSGKIGFVGGQEIDLIKKFYAGYAAGAKTANPRVEVLRPQYTGSWDDVGKGKLFGAAQYSAGADIVYHAAGRCGLGVFQAAQAAGKYAIGVDSDQDDQAEGLVLTSMIKRVDEAVFQTIKDVKEGKFSAGAVTYDLKANGVGLSEMRFTKDKIGPENLAKIEGMRKKIISGELVVPTDMASLERYVAGLPKG